ncbi:uncharacterized protein LOC119792304 [Cyprinodon tularosa]|uniref:uncharacterized protein LOC119792304 n=1 Tax=Cyprinodon tularosa TaxID=77115 RepID=UPI0018E27CCF|nr:uncharacterized protein LOC119792304 [Cyprinodon tularosa]
MLGSYKCIMWFVFLLRLTLCSCGKADTEEKLVKTIGREADFTPACSNITQDLILYITCRIRPVRSGREDCILSFLKKKGFNTTQGCDPRFSLILINRTVFLQMYNLLPENSGNYSCHCVLRDGTLNLHLNITVEGDETTTSSTKPHLNMDLTSATEVLLLVFFIITGIILGVCYGSIFHQRSRLRPPDWHKVNSTVLFKEAVDVELSHLTQEEKGLYSNVKMLLLKSK